MTEGRRVAPKEVKIENLPTLSLAKEGSEEKQVNKFIDTLLYFTDLFENERNFGQLAEKLSEYYYPDSGHDLLAVFSHLKGPFGVNTDAELTFSQIMRTEARKLLNNPEATDLEIIKGVEVQDNSFFIRVLMINQALDDNQINEYLKNPENYSFESTKKKRAKSVKGTNAQLEPTSSESLEEEAGEIDAAEGLIGDEPDESFTDTLAPELEKQDKQDKQDEESAKGPARDELNENDEPDWFKKMKDMEKKKKEQKEEEPANEATTQFELETGLEPELEPKPEEPIVEEAATKLEPQPDKVQYYPTHDKPLMQQVKEQLYQHDIVQLRLDKKHFGDLLSSAINRELNSLSNLRYIKPTGKIGKLPKLVSDVNPQIVVGDIDNDNVPVTVEAHLNWGGMFGFRKNADLTIDLPIRVDELELLDTRDLNIEITHNSSSASDLAETVKEILSKGNLMLTLGQSIFGQFITEIQESGIRITDKPKFGISGGQVLITLTKFSRRELNNESTDLVGE